MYLLQANAKQARDLIDVLREAKQQIHPKLEQLTSYGGFGKFLNLFHFNLYHFNNIF